MEEVQEKKQPVTTYLLIVLLGVIAIGLSLIAIRIGNQKPQTPTINIQPEQIKAQTTLTISSNPVKLSTPSAYSTDILINTNKNVVDKVQLEISYDPNILGKVDIIPGDFFDTPKIFLKNLDAQNGRVSYVIGSSLENEGKSGKSIIAKLNFVILTKTATATASVTLLPKTQATSPKSNDSVLKTTIDGLFTLTSITPRATNSSR